MKSIWTTKVGIDPTQWKIQSHKLRTARENTTLRQFARWLGVSPSYWSKVERGIAVPDVDTLMNACKLCRIKPERLFGNFPKKGGAV